MLSVIANQTYYDFAKKYKIKLSHNKKKKSIIQLRNEIKDFEKNNKIKNGLYY